MITIEEEKMKQKNNNERKCDVCERHIIVDDFGNGECPYCGWYNNLFSGEKPREVIFPNLISLCKAQKMYLEGKAFKPSLEDFLDATMFYGETQFNYKSFNCLLVKLDDSGSIEFNYSNSNGLSETILYKDRKDFCEHAKIECDLIKDIWDDVEDVSYV